MTNAQARANTIGCIHEHLDLLSTGAETGMKFYKCTQCKALVIAEPPIKEISA
jgi:hypothetical protein